MIKKFFIALIATVMFVSSTCVAKSAVIDVEFVVPEIAIYQDVTFAQYFKWPQNCLKMDVYAPTVKEKSPAVIFVPDGRWIASSKDAGTQLCFRPAADGRLSTMVGVTDDVEKFDFGENLDQSSQVQAVVDIFGSSDLTKIAADFPKDTQKLYDSPGGAASLLVNGVTIYKGNKGGSLLDTPATAGDLNPLTYIDKNTPPFLIMHGNADQTVSPSQSKILYDALIKNGVDAEHYIINGSGHDFKYFFQPKTFGIIVDFLHRVLK